MKNDGFDLLKKRHRTQKNRRKTASTDSFDRIYYPAINFAEEIFQSKSDYDLLAYNNTIVNLVSALEVYLKQIVIEYEGRWVAEGYSRLLKDNINLTLTQAYELFASEKVTREFLITHFYSFQNFEIINRVFSDLTAESRFFTTLKIYKTANISKGLYAIERDAINYLDDFADWEGMLMAVFEIRNKFVHQGIETRLTYKKLEKYCDLVSSFHTMVEMYLYERFNPS